MVHSSYAASNAQYSDPPPPYPRQPVAGDGTAFNKLLVGFRGRAIPSPGEELGCSDETEGTAIVASSHGTEHYLGPEYRTLGSTLSVAAGVLGQVDTGSLYQYSASGGSTLPPRYSGT